MAAVGRAMNDRFFTALSEADSFCAELDTARESQCRIDELEAELAEARKKIRSLLAWLNAM